MEQKELNIVNFVCAWKIPNYIHQKKLSNKLLSPVFSNAHNSDVKWQLEHLPINTQAVPTEEDLLLEEVPLIQLTISLTNFGMNSDVRAYVTISINHKHDTVEKFRHTFTKENNRLKKFYKQLIPMANDTVTIKCEIEAVIKVKRSIKTTKLHPFRPSIEILHLDYEMIMRDDKFSDAKLITSSGKEFPVHLVILSTRSPALAALLEPTTNDRIENPVQINDVSDDTMEEMLRYIYTGKVERLNELACELMIASDKYDLPVLKQLCEKYLCDSLSVDKAVSVLKLADLHGATELKAQALYFIAKNLSSIIYTPGFQSFKETHWPLVEEILKKIAFMAVPAVF